MAGMKAKLEALINKGDKKALDYKKMAHDLHSQTQKHWFAM